MANPFIHVELSTLDKNKAESFYAKLFDWKTTDMRVPEGSYTTIDVGEGTGGGITEQHNPSAASSWLPYVQVDDIKASTKKAVTLGAKLKQDVTEIPEMGWLSVITDPTGATIGLWQTMKPMKKQKH